MICNLKEEVKPVSILDSVLSSLIISGDSSGLSKIDGGIPPHIAELFSLAISNTASINQYYDLINIMARDGLVSTILAMADLAISRCPPVASITAVFFKIRESVEEQAGMRWAAAVDRRISQRLTDQINRDEELPVPEDSRLQIVDAWNQPDEFAHLSRHYTSDILLSDPLRDPIITKRNHFLGELKPVQGVHVDFSFFVLDSDDSPILQVECDTSHCNAPLRCRESPILIVAFTDDQQLIDIAVKLAVDQMLWINSWAGTRGIHIDYDVSTDVGRALQKIAHPIASGLIHMKRGSVSLLRDINDIFNSYRQNHKRSIRKCMKYVSIDYVDNSDNAAVILYSELHRKINRTPALSCARLAEILSYNGCRLYGAYYDKDPVGFALITGHGRVAYYAAGIMSGPDNIPIGHALIHQAIHGAKNDGFIKFDFGLLDVMSECDQKLLNITNFKLGFCNEVSDRITLNSNVM